MPWIENDNKQIDLPSFGFFERKEIYEKIMIFLKSINPICFVFGKKGSGKTTFIKELFNEEERNSYWLDSNFKNKKALLDIPNKEELVLIIDNFELSKKCFKILTWVLGLLDLDNPQFKLILISNTMDVVDYLDILQIKNLEEVSNFYQVHKINFDLFPPKTDEIIKHMKSNSNYTKNQINKILKIGVNSFNEISFLDKILVDIIDNDNISNDLLKSLFNKEWKNVVKNALDEYNNKESKIRNALFSLALNEKKTVRELKPILKQTLIENNFITIKNSHMELTSEILRNWILEEKILHERSYELIKRDITKILIKNPIQYVKISLKLLALNEVKFEWLITEILNSELKSVSFRDKIKAVVLLLRNILVNDNMTEKALNYAEEFYFSVFADIKTDFENSVNSLSQLLILSNMVNPKIVFVGFQEIMYDCRSKNYSEKAIEEFVWIYINYFVRSIPNLTQLVDLLQSLIEENRISELSRIKNLHVIALFMGYNEQYSEAFNILYDSLIKDNQNLDFRYYTSLITISGLLNHYKPKKEQNKFLDKQFKDAILLKEKTKKFLKIATAIEANLAIGLDNYQERITKLKDIIEISEKNAYTEVLAASFDKIAQLLMQKGKIDEAQTYFDKALQLSDGLNYEYGNAITANKVANLCMENGNLLDAEKYFQEAMHYALIENSSKEYLDSALKLSFIKKNKGEFEETKILLDNALSKAKIWKDFDIQFTIYCNQGFAELTRNNFTEFTNKLKLAKDLDNKINLYDEEKAFLELGEILGKSQISNASITIKISQFKDKYKQTGFRREIFLILIDFLFSNADFSSEVKEFILYIIHEINFRGLTTSFLNDFLVKIRYKIDIKKEIRQKEFLCQIIDLLKKKYDIENQYHLVLSFLVEDLDDYENYTDLQIKRILDKITFEPIHYLLALISKVDDNLSLANLVMTSDNITSKLYDKDIAKSTEEEFFLLLMKMVSAIHIGDQENALEKVQEIEEFLIDKDDCKISDLVIYLDELSGLFYRLKQYKEAINKIKRMYEKFQEKMSPDEEASVLLNMAENHYRLEELDQIKNILAHLEKLTLINEKNRTHHYSITIRYMIKNKEFIQAREKIEQIVFNYNQDKKPERLSVILYDIYEYIIQKDIITETDLPILQFFRDTFELDGAHNFELQTPSMLKIIMYFNSKNDSDKVKELTRVMIDYCNKCGYEEAAKPFYYYLLEVKIKLKEDIQEEIIKIEKLKSVKAIYDYRIYDLYLYFLMENKQHEKAIDILLYILEIIDSIKKKNELEIIPVNSWNRLFGIITGYSLFSIPQNKRRKMSNYFNSFKNDNEFNDWLRATFSLIDKIYKGDIRTFDDILNDLDENKEIPIEIRETIRHAITGKISPEFYEKQLLSGLDFYKKENEEEEILDILDKLCDFYLKNKDMSNFEKYINELSIYSNKCTINKYKIITDFYKAQSYFIKDKIEKSQKVCEKLLTESLPDQEDIFIDSSVFYILCTFRLEKNLKKSLEKISYLWIKVKEDLVYFLYLISNILVNRGNYLVFNSIKDDIYDYIKKENNLTVNQKLMINELKLWDHISKRDITDIYSTLIEISNTKDNFAMWSYILHELPKYLMAIILERRKTYFIELGAKLGRELHRNIPEQYYEILKNLYQNIIDDIEIDENSADIFFKSFLKTLDYFGELLSDKKSRELKSQYKLLLIVEGVTEEKILPIIFDKFYSNRLVDWKNHIAILPLYGKYNIKRTLEKSNIKLDRLAENFIVFIDSDKTSEKDLIPKENREILDQTYEKGGISFILNKKEIENYIHPAALSRILKTFQWDKSQGLFKETENVKDVINNHKKKSHINKKVVYIKVDIFNEMTHEEFNEVQMIKISEGIMEKEFDLLVDKIIYMIYT